MADEVILRKRRRIPEAQFIPWGGGAVRRKVNTINEVSVTVTTAMHFASGVPDFPDAASGVDFASAFVSADKFGPLSGGVLFHSRFRCVEGGLATGRYRR